MRGVELPINVIVIVVICMVVLLAIIALFFGVWNPGKTSITLEAAKTNACQMLVSMGCNQDTFSIAVRDFDANKNNAQVSGDNWDWNDAVMTPAQKCGTTATSQDNLAALCYCYYSRQNENDCKNLCGCTS